MLSYNETVAGILLEVVDKYARRNSDRPFLINTSVHIGITRARTQLIAEPD